MNTLGLSLTRSLTVVLALLLGAAYAQVAAGDALVDEGNFEEAIAAYTTAVNANANDARALFQRSRAQVYWADNDASLDDAEREALYTAALADSERAVELAPNNTDALFELSRALGRMAQYRGVLQSLSLAGRMNDTLQRVLELDDGYAAAWHAYALWHNEVPWIAGGRTGNVEPYFERAIELEPDAITHRVGLAEILIAAEEYDRAAEQLDVALSLTATTYLQGLDLERARELQASLP